MFASRGFIPNQGGFAMPSSFRSDLGRDLNVFRTVIGIRICFLIKNNVRLNWKILRDGRGVSGEGVADGP